MDENLVIHAIQFKNETLFVNRYKIFSTKELRDWEFDRLIRLVDTDAPEKVELVIRVETEYE